MLNLQFLAPLTLLVVASQASAAIVLACSGYIEQTGDGPNKRDPVTVTVAINEGDDALKINGWWGCLLSVAQDNYSRREHDKCEGFLTYTATSTEFKFHDGHDGKEYSAGAQFTIDRITGKFKGFSSANAKPAAGASWKHISTSIDMTCKPASRAF